MQPPLKHHRGVLARKDCGRCNSAYRFLAEDLERNDQIEARSVIRGGCLNHKAHDANRCEGEFHCPVSQTHLNMEKAMIPFFRQFVIYILVCMVGGSALLADGNKPNKAPGEPASPIRYIGKTPVNVKLADGGLPWAVGVQSYQVLRASRLNPRISDGQGWTFFHAPMLAYWKGKFYVEFISSPIQENGFPTNVMMANSPDGRNWSMPEVVFPQWNSFKDPQHPIRSQLHQRMGFYVAPNGKLLVISHYGLWASEENHIFGGPGHVIREVGE